LQRSSSRIRHPLARVRICHRQGIQGIAAMLRQHGFQSVVEPMNFLVNRHDHLLPGEEEAR
jgi:hypothetical protein